ncbi:MAG: secondary thiamine-phosphate synthase enzyme YjbQ [Nitrospirota bacterium]
MAFEENKTVQEGEIRQAVRVVDFLSGDTNFVDGDIMITADTITLSTNGFTDVIDITEKVTRIAEQSGIQNGLVTVFCSGSTGGITTIEFESGVINDLKKAIEKIAPSNIPYEHDKRWGDGNGFSHVRAALMKPSLTIPVVNGKLALGTWQQIVFMDFDNRERKRKVVVQIMGE